MRTHAAKSACCVASLRACSTRGALRCRVSVTGATSQEHAQAKQMSVDRHYRHPTSDQVAADILLLTIYKVSGGHELERKCLLYEMKQNKIEMRREFTRISGFSVCVYRTAVCVCTAVPP